MTPPSLVDKFRSLIHHTDFPCVGAKSALAKGTLDVLVARDIRSTGTTGASTTASRALCRLIARIARFFRVSR
jgi:hypothetical protein